MYLGNLVRTPNVNLRPLSETVCHLWERGYLHSHKVCLTRHLLITKRKIVHLQKKNLQTLMLNKDINDKANMAKYQYLCHRKVVSLFWVEKPKGQGRICWHYWSATEPIFDLHLWKPKSHKGFQIKHFPLGIVGES